MTNLIAPQGSIAQKAKGILRLHVERVLRRLPVSRLAFAERDTFAARLRALEVAAPGADRLSAIAQVEALDPHRLEDLVPVGRSADERILMATVCRDADVLPRVVNAGTVTRQDDGTVVQIMHNGIKVLAGGYYGAWMQELITRCKGIHEPQEEVAFAEITKHVPDKATMIEVGGFWSYYSIWFLSGGGDRRAIVVEPDPAHIEVGRTNARLNACQPSFVQAFVGRHSAPPSLFQTEESGAVELPCISVADLMASEGIDYLDVLHCDAQGAELDILEGCQDFARTGRLGWVVVSTHSHHISGDPLTHQRCLGLLASAGANILAEHDIQESFSGDGLIVAKFGPVPEAWQKPRLSYNRYSESLFRNPLYDLVAAKLTPRSVPPPRNLELTPEGFVAALYRAVLRRDADPAGLAHWSNVITATGDYTTVLAGFLESDEFKARDQQLRSIAASTSLAMGGGLLAITADCSLGGVGDTLIMPFDQVMYPATVAGGGWAQGMLDFVMKHADSSRSYVVLDIGANVGLFTRQIALRLPTSARFLCVEPDPGNFRALQYNVQHLLGDRACLWNVALSESDSDAQFFRDDRNIGNYSLNSDAMRDRQFTTVTVRCAAVDRWMRDQVQLAERERLIWKSDTQGHDELIISRTPMEVWDRIDVAVVELWRIKKSHFDREAFCQRLDAFPNKSIGIGELSTTAEILQYLQGDDWKHDDLYLWR